MQGSDGRWYCMNQCGWSAVTPPPTAVQSGHAPEPRATES